MAAVEQTLCVLFVEWQAVGLHVRIGHAGFPVEGRKMCRSEGTERRIDLQAAIKRQTYSAGFSSKTMPAHCKSRCNAAAAPGTSLGKGKKSVRVKGKERGVEARLAAPLLIGVFESQDARAVVFPVEVGENEWAQVSL